MTMLDRGWFRFGVFLVACALALPATAAGVPNVAAAADLQFALPAIAAAFQRDTGRRVQLAFGSSGNFRRQIAEGAPFELFLSADEAMVEALSKEGRTDDAGIRYATGRIVLFVPTGSALALDPTFADLKRALADGRVQRFAIANPEHAPYGRVAEQALRSAGVWDALVPRLVLGENVSQAAQFATSGSAQGGIFAYSLALAPPIAGKGTSVLLPAASHAPLQQRMVLVKGAGESAREFYRYLQQPSARDIFKRYGFTLPGE
ncbi:MAG: molybdate ABC transporter substrate-binding protein [Casimicrobiaceae bacterium]